VAQEKVLYEGRLPLRVYHFSHGIIWLLLLGWNFGLLWSWLRSLGLRVKITSTRIVVIRGIVSRSEEQVEYYRVHDSKYEQGFIQRIFNVGTITLHSDDMTSPELTFPIVNPEGMKEQIQQHVLQQRRSMRTIQMD
jgi:membrane protein YdbS with pleckstrin-like domain